MKSTDRAVSIVAIGLSLLIAGSGTATAQSTGEGKQKGERVNVGAVYRVSVTDPATGNVYYVDRKSLRTWDSKASCKNQMASFSGFHTRAVRQVGLKNRKGKPLKVEMSDMFCVVRG